MRRGNNQSGGCRPCRNGRAIHIEGLGAREEEVAGVYCPGDISEGKAAVTGKVHSGDVAIIATFLRICSGQVSQKSEGSILGVISPKHRLDFKPGGQGIIDGEGYRSGLLGLAAYADNDPIALSNIGWIHRCTRHAEIGFGDRKPIARRVG